MQNVKSICLYCGCGCSLDYQVENGKLIKVLPDSSDQVSEGKPCIKGLTIHEVVSKGRNLQPMIRKNKSKPFKKVSWQQAYEFIYKNTKDLSPDEVFFSPSGKITNEDNYIIQKFSRIAYKTNNVDGCCSRLCHIATVKALNDSFGNSAIPSRMDDVHDCDCILIIGSNPASNYPVFFNKILKAKEKGVKIISVQSIKNDTSEYANLHLTIQPGTELVFLNGIINQIIKSKSYDKSVEMVEEFSKLAEIAEEYDMEQVSELCGVKIKVLQEAANYILNSKRFGVIHGMGLTQHVNAIENVHSLLNLVILKNGRILSNRGEINVQGVGDMGCSPDCLPSGPLITCERLEKIWNTEVSKEKGKNIIEAILISPVKAAFISGFNPAQSLPNADQVHKNLRKMFLVQCDSYFNLTSKFANVILPTPILIERNGTITNGERRVRLVRKVIEPSGSSKSEWLIFKEFSKFFDCQKHFDYKNEKEIFEEITDVIPAYDDIDPDFVYKGNDEWADKEKKFTKFNPEEFEGVDDVKSKKYPFIFTTFRSPYQFLTGEATRKSKTLSKFDNSFCHMNIKDAKKLKIKNGNKVKITSNTGSLKAKIKIDEKIPEGIVGMHFHFEEALVNKLFPVQFDEETFTPNYKIIAVNIEKI